MIITEIRPAWTRSFLDSETPFVVHIVKTDHRNKDDEHLFAVVYEDPFEVCFRGVFTGRELHEQYSIIL